MTKKHITYPAAFRAGNLTYNGLKAEIEAGFQAEADYHACPECKEYQHVIDYLTGIVVELQGRWDVMEKLIQKEMVYSRQLEHNRIVGPDNPSIILYYLLRDIRKLRLESEER